MKENDITNAWALIRNTTECNSIPSDVLNFMKDAAIAALEVKPKRVLILKSQEGDWEGLYINNQLIDEAHVLGEGRAQMYIIRKSEEYNFTSDDVAENELNDEDEKIISISGGLPLDLRDLKGKYL